MKLRNRYLYFNCSALATGMHSADFTWTGTDIKSDVLNENVKCIALGSNVRAFCRQQFLLFCANIDICALISYRVLRANYRCIY